MIHFIPAAERGIYRAVRPLVLASASPRRRDFLASLGLAFHICPCPDSVEPHPEQGETPGHYTRRAASGKAAHAQTALAGHETLREAVVLGVDTAVILEGAILGKPKDAAEALAFIRRLAGRRHQVVSACSLRLPGGKERVFSVESFVRMWDAPEAVLKAYADSPEPLDKAGGYAVQGIGAFLVESIEGSWSGVVGLPLAELVRALLDEHAISPQNHVCEERACTGATE